jgi:hypothetical protein
MAGKSPSTKLATKVLEELTSESKKMKAAGLSPEAIKAQLKVSNPSVSPSDINKAVKEVDVSKIKVNIPEKADLSAAPVNPIPPTPTPGSASNAGTLPPGISKPTLDHKKVLENLNADEIAADVDASKAGKWNKKKVAAATAGGAGLAYGAYDLTKGDAENQATTPPEDDKSGKSSLTVTKGAIDEAGLADEKAYNLGELNAFVKEPKLENVPGIDPLKVPPMETAINEYNRVVNEAMTLYRQEKDNIKAKQLWEGIIHGVALMAAGAYGLKTGNYATGVKFEPTDWSAQLNASRAELEAGLNQARTVLDISDKEADRKRQIWESNRQYRNDVINKNQQQWENAFKGAQLNLQTQQGNIDIKSKEVQLSQKDRELDIMDDDKKARNQAAKLKLMQELGKDKGAAVEKAMKVLYDNHTGDKGGDTTAVKRAAAILQESGIALPPDALTKEGWFGPTDIDPESFADKIYSLRYASQQGPMASVFDEKTGRTTMVKPELAKKFEGRPGFKVTYD